MQYDQQLQDVTWARDQARQQRDDVQARLDEANIDRRQLREQIQDIRSKLSQAMWDKVRLLQEIDQLRGARTEPAPEPSGGGGAATLSPPGVTRLPSNQIRRAANDRRRRMILMDIFHPDSWPTDMQAVVTPIFQQLSASQPARSTGTN